MTKQDIELLYEYDRWANGRVFDAASALTGEQFARNLGGGFPSVRDALLHIVAGEWIWLQFWKAETLGVKFVSELEKRRDSLFRPDPSGLVSDCCRRAREMGRSRTGAG